MDETPFPFSVFQNLSILYFFMDTCNQVAVGKWYMEALFMVACHFCMYLPLPLLVVMFGFDGTYDDRYGGSDSRIVMVWQKDRGGGDGRIVVIWW